jgi:hypothetical protein
MDINNMVTIRQIKEISSQNRRVFIKPSGRRIYYIGNMNDIPCSLLDSPIIEISAQAFYDDDIHAIKRYYAELGLFINPIPEWDKQIDDAQVATAVQTKTE